MLGKLKSFIIYILVFMLLINSIVPCTAFAEGEYTVFRINDDILEASEGKWLEFSEEIYLLKETGLLTEDEPFKIVKMSEYTREDDASLNDIGVLVNVNGEHLLVDVNYLISRDLVVETSKFDDLKYNVWESGYDSEGNLKFNISENSEYKDVLVSSKVDSDKIWRYEDFAEEFIASQETDDASFLEHVATGFLLIIGDGIKWAIGAVAGGKIGFDSLIFNKYKNTNISLFDTSGTFAYTNPLIENYGLKGAVSKVYGVFSTISTITFMTSLLYIGIKIALSSTGKDRSKYKSHLYVVLKGAVLLFVFPAIMNIMVEVNYSFVGTVSSIGKEFLTGSTANKMPAIEEYPFSGIETAINFGGKDTTNYDDLDFMGQLRYKAFATGRLAYAIAWLVLLMEMIKFIFIYFKRLLVTTFLTTIFPLVTMTYAIDKVGDGKSQAFASWTKEYTLNIFLQTFHAVNYVIVMAIISSVSNISKGGIANYLLIMVGITYVTKGEGILRGIFGQTGRVGTVQNATEQVLKTEGLVAAVQGARKLAKNTRKRISKLNDTRRKYEDEGMRLAFRELKDADEKYMQEHPDMPGLEAYASDKTTKSVMESVNAGIKIINNPNASDEEFAAAVAGLRQFKGTSYLRRGLIENHANIEEIEEVLNVQSAIEDIQQGKDVKTNIGVVLSRNHKNQKANRLLKSYNLTDKILSKASANYDHYERNKAIAKNFGSVGNKRKNARMPERGMNGKRVRKSAGKKGGRVESDPLQMQYNDVATPDNSRASKQRRQKRKNQINVDAKRLYDMAAKTRSGKVSYEQKKTYQFLSKQVAIMNNLSGSEKEKEEITKARDKFNKLISELESKNKVDAGGKDKVDAGVKNKVDAGVEVLREKVRIDRATGELVTLKLIAQREKKAKDEIAFVGGERLVYKIQNGDVIATNAETYLRQAIVASGYTSTDMVPTAVLMNYRIMARSLAIINSDDVSKVRKGRAYLAYRFAEKEILAINGKDAGVSTLKKIPLKISKEDAVSFKEVEEATLKYLDKNKKIEAIVNAESFSHDTAVMVKAAIDVLPGSALKTPNEVKAISADFHLLAENVLIANDPNASLPRKIGAIVTFSQMASEMRTRHGAWVDAGINKIIINSSNNIEQSIKQESKRLLFSAESAKDGKGIPGELQRNYEFLSVSVAVLRNTNTTIEQKALAFHVFNSVVNKIEDKYRKDAGIVELKKEVQNIDASTLAAIQGMTVKVPKRTIINVDAKDRVKDISLSEHSIIDNLVNSADVLGKDLKQESERVLESVKSAKKGDKDIPEELQRELSNSVAVLRNASTTDVQKAVAFHVFNSTVKQIEDQNGVDSNSRITELKKEIHINTEQDIIDKLVNSEDGFWKNLKQDSDRILQSVESVKTLRNGQAIPEELKNSRKVLSDSFAVLRSTNTTEEQKTIALYVFNSVVKEIEDKYGVGEDLGIAELKKEVRIDSGKLDSINGVTITVPKKNLRALDDAERKREIVLSEHAIINGLVNSDDVLGKDLKQESARVLQGVKSVKIGDKDIPEELQRSLSNSVAVLRNANTTVEQKAVAFHTFNSSVKEISEKYGADTDLGIAELMKDIHVDARTLELSKKYETLVDNATKILNPSASNEEKYQAEVIYNEMRAQIIEHVERERTGFNKDKAYEIINEAKKTIRHSERVIDNPRSSEEAVHKAQDEYREAEAIIKKTELQLKIYGGNQVPGLTAIDEIVHDSGYRFTTATQNSSSLAYINNARETLITQNSQKMLVDAIRENLPKGSHIPHDLRSAFEILRQNVSEPGELESAFEILGQKVSEFRSPDLSAMQKFESREAFYELAEDVVQKYGEQSEAIIRTLAQNMKTDRKTQRLFDNIDSVIDEHLFVNDDLQAGDSVSEGELQRLMNISKPTTGYISTALDATRRAAGVDVLIMNNPEYTPAEKIEAYVDFNSRAEQIKEMLGRDAYKGIQRLRKEIHLDVETEKSARNVEKMLQGKNANLLDVESASVAIAMETLSTGRGTYEELWDAYKLCERKGIDTIDKDPIEVRAVSLAVETINHIDRLSGDVQSKVDEAISIIQRHQYDEYSVCAMLIRDLKYNPAELRLGELPGNMGLQEVQKVAVSSEAKRIQDTLNELKRQRESEALDFKYTKYSKKIDDVDKYKKKVREHMIQFGADVAKEGARDVGALVGLGVTESLYLAVDTKNNIKEIISAGSLGARAGDSIVNSITYYGGEIVETGKEIRDRLNEDRDGRNPIKLKKS